MTEKQFEKHIALLGKNAGCIEKLRGRVLLVMFLVDDAKGKWDSASEEACVTMIQNACFHLMEESGLPLNQLSITYVNRHVSVPYEVTRADYQRMMRDVLSTCYCEDTESFQDIYKREMSKDEVCVSFVLNRSFTSFAMRRVSLDGVQEVSDRRGSEFSVVSFQKKKPRCSERSLIHELMHQFGAMDYYAIPLMAKSAKKYLPGSIMNDGMKIDPLTRYAIGWDEHLAPEAISFLEATKSLTTKDL